MKTPTFFPFVLAALMLGQAGAARSLRHGGFDKVVKEKVSAQVILDFAGPIGIAESMCLEDVWVKTYQTVRRHSTDEVREVRVASVDDYTLEVATLVQVDFDHDFIAGETPSENRKLLPGSPLLDVETVQAFQEELCSNLQDECPFESFRSVAGCGMDLKLN